MPQEKSYKKHSQKSVKQHFIKLLEIDITADARTGKTYTVPFACDIIETIVRAEATSASGAVTIWDASAAITDTMTFAVDGSQDRSASVDKTRGKLKAGQVISAKTLKATDRGKVSIYVQPV